jgi:SAM-dependent methyltransferase
MVFNRYAQYYDLFYKNKDYGSEVKYIESLMKIYTKNKKRDILDIGCGTGGHGFLFQKKGYNVVGIDKSKVMISIGKSMVKAKGRMKFYVGDSARFNLNKRFNLALSLFHTMSYQATNNALSQTFKNVYKHLRKGGLFIFDFWYGPAVLTHRPEIRKKRLKGEDGDISRISIPVINESENIVDVNYRLIIKNKKEKTKKEIRETHRMRYFFIPELDFMLTKTGFKIKKCLKWMSLKEKPDFNNWYAIVVAQK